jgi:hypothetical protein
MLYLFVPPRFRPAARIVIGLLLVVVGVVFSRIVLVAGAAYLVWGVVSAVNYVRYGAHDGEPEEDR